jgi:protocatechuate 3,4-dioxygenase beta subunit
MRPWLAVVVVLCGLAACSGNGEETAATGTSLGETAAACETTAGASAQGTPASGAASSSITLGPSAEITEKEAAEEAPHREGVPLILSGTVYQADCETPAAGATINVWQTDARGVYGPGQQSDNLRCCYLQGAVETDAQGRFTIETIRPGHYRGEDPPPPAHIHMEVHYRGGGVLTEVFFVGDPYLPDGDLEGEVIELREESAAGVNRLTGRFDIVLPAE